MAEWRQSENTNVSNGGFGDSSNYSWWRGQDGNIWANIDGVGVRNLGKGDDLNGKGVLVNGINMDPKGVLLASREIQDPALANSSNGSGSYSYDTYTSQLNAEKARRQGEAQNIKNSMAGKRGQFTDILNEILGNIDKTYEEEVGKLSETYDEDKAELINTLADAIPEIGNSFASIGAYDSSQRAVRNADTREEESKAEKDLEKEFEDNKANMGNKRNSARNDAQNAYDNFMIDFDTLDQTEANSDNLETLRQSQNSLLKGLSDFGLQRNIFKPGSTFANEMSSLNNYNGAKAKNALSNFLTSAGASGMSANNNGVGSANKQNSSNKKQESELEVNQKTGVK